MRRLAFFSVSSGLCLALMLGLACKAAPPKPADTAAPPGSTASTPAATADAPVDKPADTPPATPDQATPPGDVTGATPPAGTATAFDPASFYPNNCSGCHGVNGEGQPQKGPPYAKVLSGSDAELTNSILEGKGKKMPSFKDRLKPEEATALLAWFRTQFGPK